MKQDVENELQWEPAIEESHIGVVVNDGIVSLSGYTPSYAEKYLAEKTAKRVYGVQAVVDDLEVKLPVTSKRTDEDIAKACLFNLRNSLHVPDEQIKVVVEKGLVKLEGEVDWQFQRAAAERAVRDLTGVVCVTNNIRLKSHASTKGVKDKIIAAFHRSADIDARRINVETHDGTVKISGNVRSWSEREEAMRAAWAAPGVTSVENDIIVTP